MFKIQKRAIKADSHIPCCSPAMLCHWGFRICLSHLIYTVRSCLIHTCHAHALFWPCRSSQGHGTAWLSRDGLWATWPHLASSGYHMEFHKDCSQKHTNPPHNDPYLRLQRVVAAHCKKDDLLNCWTSSLDISANTWTFTKDTAVLEQGRGMAWHAWINERLGHGMLCVNRPLELLWEVM
jgi:hypothetical protein